MEFNYLEWAKGALAIVSSSMTSIDAAVKITKSIKDLRKVETPAALGQADDQILDLREQLMTIREQNLMLRDALLAGQEQLGKRQTFEAEASNYRLEKFEGNSLAYVLKQPVTEAEKSLRLCANCFSNGIKSILQFDSVDGYFDNLKCPTCASKIRVRNNADLTPMVSSNHRNWDFDVFS